MSKETEKAITDVMSDIAAMLIEKNRAYGDSALDPVRILCGYSQSKIT